MVAECYLETDIQQFDLKAIEIVNALDEDLSKYTTTQVQTMLGNKYTSLLHNDRWPHKSKMQELSEAVGQLQALSTEVGHLKALQLKQPGGTAGSTSTPKAEKQDTSNPAIYVVPKEGEAEVKMIDGVEHKFCRLCKYKKSNGKAFWRRAPQAHTTSEHKPFSQIKEEKTKAEKPKTVGFAAPTGSANMLSSPDDSGPEDEGPPITGGLRLMSSLNMLQALASFPNDEDEEGEGAATVGMTLATEGPPRRFDDDDDDDDGSSIYSTASEGSASAHLNCCAGHR